MSEIDLSFVKKIFAPQISFEGVNQIDKFARFFCDLYRIELFKDGLDLILTKVYEKDLSFEVHLVKDWDTNLGCYLTEQSKVFNKVAGVFSSKIKKKIIIKSFKHNVLAHEMAHALEFESEIDLNQEFRKCIGFDMKNRQADLITLRAEIKRLMVDALVVYPQNQFLSEIFARYFELLSISSDVIGKGDFKTEQVIDFFSNSSNFVTQVFNPKIKAKIHPKIAKETNKIKELVQLQKAHIKFQDNVNSFHKKTDETGNKKWAKNVNSSSKYFQAWNKYQEIEDKKDN